MTVEDRAIRSTPLRRWEVRNFKSIREATLEFGGLTVLVGANSSGKTSLLQSILLLVQAAQAGSEGVALPLNGPLVSVGAFKDARFARAKDPIGLGGSFEPGRGPRTPTSRLQRFGRMARPTRWGRPVAADWWAEFDAPAAEGEPGSADTASVRFEIRGSPREDDAGGPIVSVSASRRGQGPLEEDRLLLQSGLLAAPFREEFETGFTGTVQASESPDLPVRGLQLRAGLPQNVLTPWTLRDIAAWVWVETRGVRPFWAAPLGVGLGTSRARFPKRTTGEAPAEEIGHWADVAVGEIRGWAEVRMDGITLPEFLAERRAHLPHDERALLRDFRDEVIEAITSRLGNELEEEVSLPPETTVAELLYGSATEILEFLRDRVVYLGPLRQDPQVVYKTAPTGIAGFIGTKGEYMATVLHAYRNRDIEGFDEAGDTKSQKLAEAVGEWARRLQMADEILTKDMARLGIQVSVRRGDIPVVDITGVGVGVSQLLPVLVMCLMAQPGSLILLEQPELHLHPALQQRLGDFLLACARSGRQLIVETHSEYLLSRLRRRIAEDPSDELIDVIAVYFVEQINDESHFRRVALNEFGGVEDWPAGFFDQAASDSRALLEAGLAKKSRRSEAG